MERVGMVKTCGKTNLLGGRIIRLALVIVAANMLADAEVDGQEVAVSDLTTSVRGNARSIAAGDKPSEGVVAGVSTRG